MKRKPRRKPEVVSHSSASVVVPAVELGFYSVGDGAMRAVYLHCEDQLTAARLAHEHGGAVVETEVFGDHNALWRPVKLIQPTQFDLEIKAVLEHQQKVLQQLKPDDRRVLAAILPPWVR